MPLNAAFQRTLHKATLLLLLFSCLFSAPTPARAQGNRETILSNFTEFLAAVQVGEDNTVRGVYVPDVLDLPVVQQPAGDDGYVSPHDGEITQFGMASRFGNVGLLAHNNLSGRFFSRLAVGQEVRLVYENGNVESFVITQIIQVQAHEPANPYSTFRVLNTDETLSADQLFKQVYDGARHVTFQTCIAGPGSTSWGRLFVVAMPKSRLAYLPGINRKSGR